MNNITSDELISNIAIIGMSGRFPRAKDLDEFWQNLKEGRECISFFSDEELQSSGVSMTSINNPDYVRAHAILTDVDLFDASFFGFNPREAEIIDPQQRLFLECAWEAFENAGYDTEDFRGLIGVYVSSSSSSYLINNLVPNQKLVETIGRYQINIANEKDQLPTRISYKLNLRGPSVAIQTACSSSLVAVACACQSLLDYHCDMALAGGVSIRVPQKTGYLYQEGMIGSPDGHCRAFDARAKGTVGGDGIGIVILKRMADAVADGDRIRAVIKGAAVNNDGALKAGYTAPALDGQAEVIAMAQAMAGIKAETINYVETHGTGTPLGDPIELAALTKAFRASTDARRFCAIGSAKTNLGHLDTAAGIAGLIKTVLALEHKLLPPSLHFDNPNPEIDFVNSPFFVNTQLSEWAAGEGPRRAGVSSFGIGGTNAHVILEEAPEADSDSPSRAWQLLVLSTRTETALNTANRNLVEHFQNQPNLNLADVAYTLQIGRRRFHHRRIAVCQSLDDAAIVLDTLDAKQVYTAFEASDNRPVVFMFSGQGSQYVNMAVELYQTESSFREQIDLCAEILKPHLGSDLRDVLYPNELEIEDAEHRLIQTSMAQPALFAVEYALVKLLAKWGIRPEAMIGHSLGEYVAACLAGVFSLEEALKTVALRGKLIQGLPGGAMLAIALDEQEARRLIGNRVSLAAINSPSLCVISGAEQTISDIRRELDERNISSRLLQTSHAFHSQMIEPVLPQFTEYLSGINLKSPRMKFVSNVTGTWITKADAMDPVYWSRHLRQTVCFADGIAELLNMPDAIFLEIGPGRTLATLVRQQTAGVDNRPVYSSLPHPKEQESDIAVLLKTLGRLWLAGTKVDWRGFYGNERRRRVVLPPYPFERKRYWVEAIEQKSDGESRPVSPGKNPDITDWFYLPSWNRTIPPKPYQKSALAKQRKSWMVFVDACGLGDRIVKRLKQESQDVVRVAFGERFDRINDVAFTVNPQDIRDYYALSEELKNLNKLPNRIVHLWSLTPNRQWDENSKFFEKSQYLGFYSLLFLVKALDENFYDDTLYIDVISNNIQDVTGEDDLCPAKATVLGAVKVIPQEYPNIKCRNIDITFPVSENGQDSRFTDQLLAEIAVQPSGHAIAYRGRQRWVQAYEAIKLNGSKEEIPWILKNGGVYLITGGLGDIGLVLSEYLARSVQAKLILTGRSAFPPKKEWKRWLDSQGIQDRMSRKIQMLQKLEELGAEVTILKADVADKLHMQTVMKEIDERFGCLNGVIHAAGIVTGDTFQSVKDTQTEACGRQFQPKIKGLIVLEKVLRGKQIDFCLLTSSLSSVLGGLNFASYSAANIFMDSFAQKYHQTNAVPYISVNWDGWQLRKETLGRLSPGMGLAGLAITPEEGIEVFRRILSMEPLPQIVVSTALLQPRIERWLELKSSRSAKPSKKEELSSRHNRPDILSTYVAPRNDREQAVADIWQEMLGIEKIGIHDNYFDLGGDSLLATQIIHRIREKFQIQISLDKFFEGASVASLANTIEAVRWAKQSQLKALNKVPEEFEEV